MRGFDRLRRHCGIWPRHVGAIRLHASAERLALRPHRHRRGRFLRHHERPRPHGRVLAPPGAHRAGALPCGGVDHGHVDHGLRGLRDLGLVGVASLGLLLHVCGVLCAHDALLPGLHVLGLRDLGPPPRERQPHRLLLLPPPGLALLPHEAEGGGGEGHRGGQEGPQPDVLLRAPGPHRRPHRRRSRARRCPTVGEKACGGGGVRPVPRLVRHLRMAGEQLGGAGHRAEVPARRLVPAHDVEEERRVLRLRGDIREPTHAEGGLLRVPEGLGRGRRGHGEGCGRDAGEQRRVPELGDILPGCVPQWASLAHEGRRRLRHGGDRILRAAQGLAFHRRRALRRRREVGERGPAAGHQSQQGGHGVEVGEQDGRRAVHPRR
mmetsp:Transcript_63436/g.177548  ORF Transcript_63436/g.177548 Transcript_63436/m.177548 type:complete len:378 (-) Transcript_63436:63-1196(-)